MNAALIVTSQLCHSHMGMALDCLGSFTRHCQDEFRLVIFGDGSLTNRDASILEQELGATVISRRESTSRLESQIAQHTNIRLFRESHPLSIKLIDIPNWVESDFFYVDSDILFVRDFTLSHIRKSGVGMAYMRDLQNAFSVDFLRRTLDWRYTLPSYFNSGLMYVSKESYDIDFVEWFLSVSAHHKYHPVTEQTCWAALSSRVNSKLIDPLQVLIPIDKNSIGLSDIIALHFVTQVRGQMAGISSWVRASIDPSTRADLRLIDPLHISVWKEALTEVQRSVQNFRQKLIHGNP